MDLVSLLSSSVEIANEPLPRQSCMSTPVVSIKVRKEDLAQSEGIQFSTVIQEATKRYRRGGPADQEAKRYFPFPSQVVCVEECLQIIVRTFIGRSLRWSEQHESTFGNGDREEPVAGDQLRYSRPTFFASLSEELIGLTPDERWCMRHALHHIGNIARCHPGCLPKGLIRAEVESLRLAVRDGALEGVCIPCPDDAVPQITFVRPPCLPLGPQGTATVEVSLGRWQSSWRLLVVHNGSLAGEFSFAGGSEDTGQAGAGEGRVGGSEGDAELVLRVVVVVRETGLKMIRSVNLGENIPGTVIFTVVGHPGSSTPSVSTSTPLLVLYPDAAQEINRVFAKMVERMEARHGGGPCAGDAMARTWRTCFKNLAVDIEYLMASLPLWREWKGGDGRTQEQCHETLEKVSEYLARNHMWETIAFLLKTFVQGSGTICVMDKPLSGDQLTTSLLKCVYAMTSQMKPNPNRSNFQCNAAYENRAQGRRPGACLPTWMSRVSAEDFAALLHEKTQRDYREEMKDRMESWVADTMAACGFEDGGPSSREAPSRSQDQSVEPSALTTTARQLPGRVRKGWGVLRCVGAVVEARESVFGFQCQSLEASYHRYVNRERAVVDLAMVTARLASCALLASQVDDAGRHLPQILTWNLIGPMLLVMLMVWGDAYEKRRERVAISIRVVKVCSTVALRMNWGLSGGIPGKVAINAGQLIWEALVFPVWLQVSLRAQLVLGLPEALLMANSCWRTSGGLCRHEWLPAVTSYAASCAAVFAVECLFRRAFLEVQVRGNSK
ncbi:unnamed protein product [Ostreobium quekettii]|uniref:Uncharacterized protein n=1 Tax=Ostreobium quekettii TaxID=121088 RepID=A0A8S1IW72_9CHLO|nr:unnamed protein product [Ostreobium quekettii]